MSDIGTKDQEISALSVSRWFDPFISVAIIIAAYCLLYGTNLSNVQLALVLIFSTTAYLFVSELSRAPWRSTARPKQPLVQLLDRTLTKFLGVIGGVVAMLFAYWLFPEYHTVTQVAYLQEAIPLVLALIIPAAFILIAYTEYRLGEKRDGTYQFGLFLRMRFKAIEWNTFLDGVLEWLVRLIFLSINFFSALYFLSSLRATGSPALPDTFVEAVIAIDGIIFALILFAILPGYLFASRLIGTAVKKVDRSWFGWAITLSCYAPLNAAVFGSWVNYAALPQMSDVFRGTPPWEYFTSSTPYALYAVGGMIILTGLFHLWSEALLGIRSANLSSRGVITTGPFRLTKHPVYVSKCIQWAFIYFPFLNAVGVLGNLQSGILFLLVCVLFAARSLAEEKLLAEDPDYVRYALYMDEKGIFAWIGRIIPFMRFAWRYDLWKRNGYLS